MTPNSGGGGNSRGANSSNNNGPLQPQHHGHSPHPPPVSPNQRQQKPGAMAQHSRILQDNTRIDTPRPTLTPSSIASTAVVASTSSSSSAAGVVSGPGGIMSPRSPHTGAIINKIGNDSNGRTIGNNINNSRPGFDPERRQVLSPPTSPPHFSPPQHHHKGFTRVGGGGDGGSSPQAIASGAFVSNGGMSARDVVININNIEDQIEGEGSSPSLSSLSVIPGSSNGPSQLSGSIQDQEHDYDLMVRHISQQIFNISSNIAVLERLVPCLGQRHKDTVELRSSLHAVLDGTRDLVKSAHGLIKALAKYHQPPSTNSTGNNNNNDIGIAVRRPTPASASLNAESSVWQRKVLTSRRQTHQRLTKDLTQVSKSFQDLQRQALEAERHKVATLRRLSSSASMRRWSQRRSDLMDLSQQDIEQGALLPNNGASSSWADNSDGMHDRELSVQEEALLREILALDGEISLQESILQEREIEILKIEEGVGQVFEVMKELGTLVQEQRGGVDFLHDNILQSRGRIQQGQQEILKASEYQRRSREKLCYLILIVSTVGALVMLAFVST
ncbi:hypothetical protein BGZ83_010829 [Gryganskiella cystojenkinii]|nr:hypothetical protein BGZ83_010829 [Gryganskiella cystojenkinii]